MSERERLIFAAILGEKKLEILEFLLQNSDENGFVSTTVNEICTKLNVSKPTTINTLKILENKKIFKRVKNGIYHFRM
ncbi:MULTISPECIES: winged helix-turn-helix domain-containing protein [unclassified Campylobacter]|uniref:winged helix-turn-helix domain-containing protein n=1 Tax=unclassified Campylobacter TaxID=2593542 RepID=UPI003D34129B